MSSGQASAPAQHPAAGSQDQVAFPLTGGRARSRDGTSLGYLEMGTGPTILCLHGALATGADWVPVATRLAQDYRVVLLDRRGHGASDRGDGEHTIDQEIEDLRAVLDQIGSVRAMCAHSFGAVVALHAMLTELAAEVGALVLYEPPLMLDPAEARHQVATAGALVAAGDWERGVSDGLQLMLGMSDGDIAAIKRDGRAWATTVTMAPALMAQARMMIGLGRVVEPLCRIEQSALLMLGELSRDVFTESIDALAAALPDTRRVVLHGERHAALARRPEVVARAIDTFLLDLARGS